MPAAFLAIAELFLQENEVHPESETSIWRAWLQFCGNLLHQVFTQYFICVNAKYPVVRSLCNSKSFLGTIAVKNALMHNAAKIFANIYSSIGAVTIHDNNLIAPP